QDPEALRSVCKAISEQLQRPDWRSFLRLARKNQPPQAPNSPPMPVAEMLLESRSGTVVETIGLVRELSAQGLIQSAMEEAYFALQLAPTYLPVHVEIGELLAKEGREEEAVRKFLTVADLYNARGESARGVRLLRRILEIAPMNLMVRERLVHLLVSQERGEEAMQKYRHLAESHYRL
ncbi:MAG TPA: hypothetical protein PJ988_11060, partial [Anaerolinea sp.]|nr:hypothetical protein [Anaerolinea sp.]